MNEELFAQVRQGTLNVASLTSEQLNSVSKFGSTLLMEAIAAKKDDISIALIKKGVALNAVNKQNETAVSIAATYQNKRIVEELVKAGADVNIQDKFGNNALWAAMASSRKDQELFKYILAHGGNPLLKNDVGLSCVGAAKKNNRQVFLDILKDYLDKE
jgi:ankyrin repeat protein